MRKVAFELYHAYSGVRWFVLAGSQAEAKSKIGRIRAFDGLITRSIRVRRCTRFDRYSEEELARACEVECVRMKRKGSCEC